MKAFSLVVRALGLAVEGVAVAVWEETAKLFHHVQNIRMDRRLGISTLGRDREAGRQGRFGDSNEYVPLSYNLVDRVMARVGIGPEDTFVDLGCGRGRVVCRVAQQQIRQVRGVELDPELAAAARENAARLKGRRSPIEIIEADAAEVELDDATIIFLYHPFGWRTLQQVLDHIESSLSRHPRTVTIVYAWARELGVLMDMRPWLKPDEHLSDSTLRVWRTRGSKSQRT